MAKEALGGAPRQVRRKGERGLRETPRNSDQIVRRTYDEIGGRDFERSKKYRDVARSGRAAIVIDDLASVDPWRPRGIEIRGRAEALEQPPRIRIHPRRIVSWGLEGDAIGYREARTVV